MTIKSRRVLLALLVAFAIAVPDVSHAARYTNEELHISMDYPGTIRPIFHQNGQLPMLMLPISLDVSLAVIEFSVSGDYLVNLSKEELAEIVRVPQVLAFEKTRIQGRPSIKYRILKGKQRSDHWLVSRGAVATEIRCIYDTPTPSGRSISSCEQVRETIEFLGDKSGSPELEGGRGWTYIPDVPSPATASSPHSLQDLPLLPSRDSANFAEWSSQFISTLQGLWQREGIPAPATVSFKDDCGKGIACVQGKPRGDLTFVYDPAQARGAMESEEGRAFVWFVLLHESHHLKTWDDHVQRLEALMVQVMNAEAKRQGESIHFHVQCLGPRTILLVPDSEGKGRMFEELQAFGHRLYPTIFEAHKAGEEQLADAWALKRWQAIFGQEIPRAINRQAKGYTEINQHRLDQARKKIGRMSPVAASLLSEHLKSMTQHDLGLVD